MERKQLSFEQVFDLRAVRIVTARIEDCYAVLGLVHGRYPYIPGEFDDYIATPKDNLYRSIHTAVFGPEGKAVEVQIRTREMHDQAELGLAAHWRYKESRALDVSYDRKIEWVRKLLVPASTSGTDGDRDFLDEVRAELFEDRVYALTPKGEVVDLPPGATPLDFAYHVHTDLGHRCRGARVNGRIVPLTRALANGEIVEIITHKHPQPSRDWLSETAGFLVSPAQPLQGARLVPEVRRGRGARLPGGGARAACAAPAPPRRRGASRKPSALAGRPGRRRRPADEFCALLRAREARTHRRLRDRGPRRDHSSCRLPGLDAHECKPPGPVDSRGLGRCRVQPARDTHNCRHRQTGTGPGHRRSARERKNQHRDDAHHYRSYAVDSYHRRARGD